MIFSRTMLVAVFLLVLSSFVFGQVAQAVDWWPLVPCGLNRPTDGSAPLADSYYQPCNQCDLIKLVKNLIDFVLFALAPILATLFFVWAGFLIITGGDSPSRLSEGKRIFWQVITGLLFLGLAWLGTNTLLKSFASDDISENWWQITCKYTPPTPFPTPVATPITPTVPVTCSDLQSVAKQNNVPYPQRNAPELDQLISCIKSAMPGTDLGSQFTFDNSHPECNYTRGARTCSTTCSHAVNSCHYGGSSGTLGSLAVDFGNEDVGDTIISRALSCGAKSARCETSAGVTIACSSPSATHVHVNAGSCDRN